MRVLGISGSMRRDSHNTALLRAAGEALPGGVEFVVWDRLIEVPPYVEDAEAATPVAVADLKSALAAADAVIFATPEYNHSVPGQLKNALDWVSRPLAGNPLARKPVLVVGASTGLFGAVWAQAELRKVLGALHADVIDEELPVGQAASVFGEDGSLVEPGIAGALRERIELLVDRTGRELVAA
jgi:chromate reductase